MGRRSITKPFTASQWKELEHQTLIFKYITAGIPVPSHLILPLRMSLCVNPSLLLSFPTSKRIEDGEPGRCKRTDGKKWRCSKEARPESKYCERHMHRGKSRSRKHVELSLTTNCIPLSLSAPQPQHLFIPCAPSYVSPGVCCRDFLGVMEGVNETELRGEKQGNQSVRAAHYCSFDEWHQTQLSIAMPMAGHDMPCTAVSQCCNDG